MGSLPVRVGIAAGHAGLRETLRERLAVASVAVIGEAGNASEAIDLARREPMDVLLLDLHLPPEGAVRALGSVLLAVPTLAAVVLVPDGEAVNAGDVVANGARGFVPRDAGAAVLGKCVSRVHAGEFWVPREQVAELAGRIRDAANEDQVRQRFAGLSTRELAIVGAVLRGETNRDIADRLGLSPQTVKNHLSNVFGKVGVASRLELALAALHATPVFAALYRTPDSERGAPPTDADAASRPPPEGTDPPQ